jgi:AraC family transcriptional regulator
MDVLEAEEATIGIVAQALASAAGAVACLREHAAHRALAQSAIELLGCRFREKLTLDALGAALDVTPFHLCRVFRAQTGTGLHAHLTRLRLRAVLDSIAEPRADLCRIGVDAGFSSHSHFTAAFRREYGLTPSAWRAARRGSALQHGHAAPAR